MKSKALAKPPSPPPPQPEKAPKPPKPSPEPDPSPNLVKRRRLTKQAVLFIRQFSAQGFKDPDLAAKTVGFKRPGIGYRLADRLSDLIESERLRVSMAEQMELDEALRLLAMVARATDDLKTQHAALRTVLQVHGVLSDKPMPPSDRRGLANQVEALIGKIRERMGSVPAGGRMRIRAAFEAETSPAPTSDSTSSTSESSTTLVVKTPEY